MLLSLLLFACPHTQQDAKAPTSNDSESLAQLIETDPSNFAAKVRYDRFTPSRWMAVGGDELDRVRAACTASRYADPAEVTFGVCAVVETCQQIIRDPRLDCSCVRCMMTLNGQTPLMGCEHRAMQADLSHACDEAPEEPTD